MAQEPCCLLRFLIATGELFNFCCGAGLHKQIINLYACFRIRAFDPNNIYSSRGPTLS